MPSGLVSKIRPLDGNSNERLKTICVPTGILPREVKTFEVAVAKSLSDKFLIGVTNPMEGGKPLRFAMKQGIYQAGWLTLELAK